MIEIKNLNKQYRPSSEEYALKNINFTFDNKGLYAIVGPSGCGKSTFLQILAGLDNDYQGEILINGETIKNIQEYISYSTQKFHHFPFLSYKQNILVNLDSNKSNDVSFYLNELELEGDISSATLSGGELARLVFIRTILSNNSVLLFDEPFSSVNETLAHKMLDILKKIAKEKLIIIVTHQNELMDKLPKIIKMKDGNFLNDIEARSNGRIEKTIHKSKSLFSFILHKMKYTPKRTSAMIAVCSIAMMFSSLTVCLKDSLSDSISNSLKSFCDEDSYVGSIKNDNNVLNNAYAVPLENINYDNKGYYYDCNYEMLFKTMNNVYISTGENKYKINSLSARSFNEFYLLEEDDGLFPQEEYMLKNEEVILGLSKSDLYAFSIYLTGAKHTPYELGEFIKENLILLDVYLGNSEYKYSEEQHFVVKGFKLTNQSCLYHTNPLWNQFIFEEQLGFPFIDSLYGDVESINTLRRYSKITFKNYDEVECFERENNYVLDKVERYSALPFNNSYLCFNSDKGFLPESKIQYLSPFAKFGNQSGYYIFEQTGLSGFANNMFFVKNEDVCDEIIDKYDFKKANTYTSSSNYLVGNITNIADPKNVFFKPIDMELSLDEIIISSSLQKYLNLEDKLNILYAYQFKILKAELKIKSVIESDECFISNNNKWVKNFFRDVLKINGFELVFNNIVTSEKTDYEQLLSYPINITKPGEEMQKTVNKALMKVQMLLVTFSALIFTLTFIITFAIITSIQIDNEKEDILLKSIGFSKIDIWRKDTISAILIASFSFILAITNNYIIKFLSQIRVINLGVPVDVSYKLWISCLVIALIFVAINAVLNIKKESTINNAKYLR